MQNMVKVLMMAALVVGGMVLTGTIASADSIVEPVEHEAYRDAMWYFVPALGDWANDLQDTVDAVPVKPEVVNLLPELAHRGEYMVYDLEGTQPPAKLADAHEDLLFALRQMTEAAQIAADDPDSAQYLMDNEMERFENARREIRGWLMQSIEIVEIGQAPAVLVAGN